MTPLHYPLDCNIAEGIGEVWCTASRALAGQYVQVFLAGFTFWDKVPASRSGSGGRQICYDVWDWDEAYEDGGEPMFLGFFWYQATNNCQESPANYGDEIYTYNPTGDYSDYYEFRFEDGCEGEYWLNNVEGDAYYAYCPELEN